MATYIIPKHLQNVEHAYLWIELIAYKLDVMQGYVPNTQNPDSIVTGAPLSTWKFIAPMDIMENITHSWEETETIHSRLAQKYTTWKKGINEGSQIANSIGTNIEKGWENMMKNSSTSPNTDISKGMVNPSKVNVPPYKADMPVIYTNSNRLEYSMEFQLAVFPEKDADPKRDIFDPVRELEKLSCAVMQEEFTKIDFPAIFSIKTVDSDLIKIPRAALTSVQPTWKGPFINGYPMSCSLQITFINMLPLYTNNFTGNRISTNNPHESNY